MIDHGQAQFDSMSREQFVQMVNYDPQLEQVLNKAIDIWDAQLSQLQQPQIQQLAQQQPQIQQQPQVQQPAQQKQQIPVPEDLNRDNDSDSEWDDHMDLVFGIKRNITLHIPHGLTRTPIIFENNGSNFNSNQ